MHHLILVREFDQRSAGCIGVAGAAGPPARAESADRMGAVYRAVREAFAEEVGITVVDPRNQISLVPLLLRDMVRFGVPAATTLRTVLAAGASTAIFDGQVLFRGQIPSPADAVEQIRGRMNVHRVGEAPAPDAKGIDDA